ncbi:MAG: hypothetical protein ACSLEM_06725 [Candidatus Malihini olakiniferum]
MVTIGMEYVDINEWCSVKQNASDLHPICIYVAYIRRVGVNGGRNMALGACDVAYAYTAQAVEHLLDVFPA